MKPLLAVLATVLATPLWAQSAPDTLLNQAMLLGPARMESAGGTLTLFGEAGSMSYVAEATGPDCMPEGSACDRIEFQAVAPPPPGGGDAAADWQGAGLGGTLTVGGDGWLVLSDSAALGDAAAAFQAWGSLIAAFQDRYGN